MDSENISGHQHRRDAHRKDLAGEHKWGDTIQLVFLFLFLVVWVLDSFILHYTTFLTDAVPFLIRTAFGISILSISFILARSGMKIVFGEEREKPHVISNGVFSVVRHPIYLGAILFYLGMICFSLSLASAAVWVMIVVFYRFISRYEEKLLLRMFGKEYSEYMEKVPMLFPTRPNFLKRRSRARHR